MTNKAMNKFEVKAFECELLSELYTSLENRKNWYRDYDSETDSYKEPSNMQDVEKLAIIADLQKRIEKLL